MRRLIGLFASLVWLLYILAFRFLLCPIFGHRFHTDKVKGGVEICRNCLTVKKGETA